MREKKKTRKIQEQKELIKSYKAQEISLREDLARNEILIKYLRQELERLRTQLADIEKAKETPPWAKATNWLR